MQLTIVILMMLIIFCFDDIGCYEGFVNLILVVFRILRSFLRVVLTKLFVTENLDVSVFLLFKQIYRQIKAIIKYKMVGDYDGNLLSTYNNKPQNLLKMYMYNEWLWSWMKPLNCNTQKVNIEKQFIIKTVKVLYPTSGWKNTTLKKITSIPKINFN